MNIIYKLINLDNNRYYIGSKCECRIEYVHNRNVIVCNKSDNIYLGSSSNKEMKDDLKINIFDVIVLEIVPDRSVIRCKEKEYLDKYNVLNDILSYNLTSETFHSRSESGRYSPDKNKNIIMNIYGETLFEYGQIQGNYSKMIGTSRKLGFKNIYYLSEYIYTESIKGKNYAEIGRSLGVSNRHFAVKWRKYFDFKKSESECFPFNKELKEKMIYMYIEQSSFSNISKMLDIELTTVSFYLQEYADSNKKFSVASKKGKTHEELSLEILKMVLIGETVSSASIKLNITKTTAYRYFYNILRKRLKISDL